MFGVYCVPIIVIYNIIIIRNNGKSSVCIYNYTIGKLNMNGLIYI